MVDEADDDRDIYLLALEIAKSIEELHRNDIAHGCLKPSYILFDAQRNLFLTGLGLLSFKKYLSLITGYSNKTMYSATEILADKNNITIKATK
jgi:serine/threonine protein kinase